MRSSVASATRRGARAEPYAGKVGAFEGANYEAKGYFRPQVDASCSPATASRSAPSAGAPRAGNRPLRQALEKVRDDQLASLPVGGVALAECTREQSLLGAGAPGEGGDDSE